jgi:uncharacterized membrane protein (UPF0127 family)
MRKPTFLDPLIGSHSDACELIDAASGAVLASRVESAFDSTARKKGLLGRECVPEDYALIIAPTSAVHTWFMRVAIDLVFVSRRGTVTKTCRAVKPWRMAGSLAAFAVIETAAGFIDRHAIEAGRVVAVRAVAGRPSAAPR